jgi:hypothetical protein
MRKTADRYFRDSQLRSLLYFVLPKISTLPLRKIGGKLSRCKKMLGLGFLPVSSKSSKGLLFTLLFFFLLLLLFLLFLLLLG